MALLEPRDWEGKIRVGDAWTDGGAGVHPVVSPSTGEELGRIGHASAADVRRAAEAASAAQRDWAGLPYTERAAVLRRAGDLYQQHAAEIEQWLRTETGAAPGMAGFQIGTTAQEFYEAAALASAPYGEVLRTAVPGRTSFSRQVPVGVVGVIAPFNVPTILAIRAVAPALALGNAVLLKPDPRTSVSGGVVFARILEEAGLPAGLLSVLPGGAETGSAVIEDPAVRVIAFTGSTRAGRAIGELAGRHLKRVHLELGGNSAIVVLPGTDPSAASSVGAFGSFNHQGQICMVAGRHLVHSSLAEEYTANLAARADKLTVGDPASGDVALGPIIDERQRDNIHAIVTETLAAGAELRAGGTYDRLFYRPTVLGSVPADSRAFREEIFGPVAPVTVFDTVDEAVELARSSEYGLSLSVLGPDPAAAYAVAERIPSGLVHINDQTVQDEAVAPFGGVLDSGTGGRHGGTRANLESFTETRWTTIRADLPQYPF
ncbi:aldehyde dehydrogenase family protein [Phaeacidiphilus oryzae]|uniref:aldehyde dehydrogenase family protein n=1 Tax=Phaeacidiphilus oryzae TaxID=348818 RepID=UPI00055E9621|nr:aldehyde dehydrogenase family protein [Phaeacidiphilus oryzae]